MTDIVHLAIPPVCAGITLFGAITAYVIQTNLLRSPFELSSRTLRYALRRIIGHQ